MHARVRTIVAILLASAVPAAALPAPVLAAGGGQPASVEELERLERDLQRQGKMTQRVEVPKSADPRLLAKQNVCGDALGSCWSTVGCVFGYCLCMAERSCLERQSQR